MLRNVRIRAFHVVFLLSLGLVGLLACNKGTQGENKTNFSDTAEEQNRSLYGSDLTTTGTSTDSSGRTIYGSSTVETTTGTKSHSTHKN